MQEEEKDIMQEGDRESYRVIAGLVTDILFEYDFATQRMCNRVCRDGDFGMPRWIENPRVNLRAKIFPGDYGLFDQFMEDVCSGKERVYAELRMLRVSGEFYWTAFEGKTVYGQDKKPIRVVGRIKVLGENETKDDREYNRERRESYDSFGYELMELAFHLIEEHLDAESAINLMLHRVADEYDLSGISIREATSRPYTMRVTYEYLRKDYTESVLGMVTTQGKERWDCFRGSYQNGYALFQGADLPKGMKEEWFNELGAVYTLLEIPMYRRQEFIGCIDFCNAYENREWDAGEIHTLKMFGRILADFLLGMRDLEETTEQVEQLQERDPLTGLYQYNVFLRKLQELIDKTKPNELCIVSSDIRHFKYINENYGISVGDELLRSFAEELGVSNPLMLLATRIYSDNVVAVTRVPEGVGTEELGKIIVGFNEAFSAKARKRYLNGKLNINSGYYLIQGDEQAETAVSNANMARKKAKEPGYAGMAIMFQDSMIEKVRKEGQLIDALPDAIKNHELQVYLQPKVSCGSGGIIGAEALVRWQKPDGRFYYPDEFIPVFERNGNIIELDYFVYREVFAWLKKRLDAGKTVVPVSMNVSRFHLRDDRILSYIKKLLEEYQVPVQYLEFELTENLYIENTDHVIPMIIELRRMGIKVSMDDFGSGYSSLNVLNDLPIDVIKLDKVFMKKSELREGDKTIISCVVEMAKKLHITVLCEGVENADQDRFLRGIGCDIIQGYYYGRPMPVGDFEEMLEKYFEKRLIKI